MWCVCASCGVDTAGASLRAPPVHAAGAAAAGGTQHGAVAGLRGKVPGWAGGGGGRPARALALWCAAAAVAAAIACADCRRRCVNAGEYLIRLDSAPDAPPTLVPASQVVPVQSVASSKLSLLKVRQRRPHTTRALIAANQRCAAQQNLRSGVLTLRRSGDAGGAAFVADFDAKNRAALRRLREEQRARLMVRSPPPHRARRGLPDQAAARARSQRRYALGAFRVLRLAEIRRLRRSRAITAAGPYAWPRRAFHEWARVSDHLEHKRIEVAWATVADWEQEVRRAASQPRSQSRVARLTRARRPPAAARQVGGAAGHGAAAARAAGAGVQQAAGGAASAGLGGGGAAARVGGARGACARARPLRYSCAALQVHSRVSRRGGPRSAARWRTSASRRSAGQPRCSASRTGITGSGWARCWRQRRSVRFRTCARA